MLSFAIEEYVLEEMLTYLSERSVVNQPEFQREFGLTDDESQAIFKVLYKYHILADDNTVNEQLFHHKHLSEEDIQYYCSKLKLCNLSFLLFIQAIPRSIDIYKDGEIPEGLQDLANTLKTIDIHNKVFVNLHVAVVSYDNTTA